jgi:hypothetical protein
MLLPESTLDRVQFAFGSQPLDGGDAAAVRLHSQYRTGFDRDTVHQDVARAALTGVTTDIRARQPKLLSQEMCEQEARLDLSRMGNTVDGY